MIVIDFWADLHGIACVAARTIGDVGAFAGTSLALCAGGR